MSSRVHCGHRLGEVDYLLADLPPGAAADKPPVIAGFIPDLDGAIVVTTPSEVASDVVQKSIAYARDLGIKVLGIVENMSTYRCPQCGTESELFEGDTEAMCQALDLPLLGRIRSIGPWRNPSTRARRCWTPPTDSEAVRRDCEPHQGSPGIQENSCQATIRSHSMKFVCMKCERI